MPRINAGVRTTEVSVRINSTWHDYLSRNGDGSFHELTVDVDRWSGEPVVILSNESSVSEEGETLAYGQTQMPPEAALEVARALHTAAVEAIAIREGNRSAYTH